MKKQRDGSDRHEDHFPGRESRGHGQPHAAGVAQGINPIAFDGLETVVTSDESKALNNHKTPKVILSASGMCDAGRVRHHLKYNLWREYSGSQYDLAAGKWLYEAPPVLIQRDKQKDARQADALRDLVAAASKLVAAVRGCQDMTARRLKKLTGKINDLLREIKS